MRSQSLGFSTDAGIPLLASAGILFAGFWVWSRGDRLESEPTNQHNHGELNPYRSCPGPCLRLARTGSTMNDERRAKSEGRRAKKVPGS
jgi:hypothetical protein